MSDPRATIHVEVAYVDADVEFLREVELPAGASVEHALRESGVRDASPGARAAEKAGIFGRVVALTEILRDGDRVELYRPLKIDPKEARRLRAAKRL
jgi:putative ubiquitin-RnfH superfamily antitoxin RatB of RatAB toxin-antitoxin module